MKMPKIRGSFRGLSVLLSTIASNIQPTEQALTSSNGVYWSTETTKKCIPQRRCIQYAHHPTDSCILWSLLTICFPPEGILIARNPALRQPESFKGRGFEADSTGKQREAVKPRWSAKQDKRTCRTRGVHYVICVWPSVDKVSTRMGM
jgi:hypothetical protein